MAHVNAIVLRHRAHSSNENVTGGRIEILCAGMIAGGEGIIFPAHAIGERQLGSHLPAVSSIPSPGGELQGVGNDVLRDLAVSLWETEHELAETVVAVYD